ALPTHLLYFRAFSENVKLSVPTKTQESALVPTEAHCQTKERSEDLQRGNDDKKE
ncbi:hypothetical protein CCACVL1_22403, partial [Corchorus capsularis]